MKHNVRITMTVSMPRRLYLWLKQFQNNVSAYVVEAIEARRHRDDKDETQVHKTTYKSGRHTLSVYDPVTINF